MTIRMDEAISDAAAWWAGKLGASYSSKKGFFEQALLGLLLAEWTAAETEFGPDARIDLEVDYDPCEILLGALRVSGIECQGCCMSAEGIFPFKTRTRLRAGRHLVRWDAGRPVETTCWEG